MAVKVEAGYENTAKAVFITRKPSFSDWEDEIVLTVKEAESLLKKLPEAIAKSKAMKKQTR